MISSGRFLVQKNGIKNPQFGCYRGWQEPQKM